MKSSHTEDIAAQINTKKEHDYLRIILESHVYYNAESRAAVANVLRAEYKSACVKSDFKLAQTLVVELFTKLLQVVEDVALFGLMFGVNPLNRTKR